MVYKNLSDNKITVECQISNGLIGKARHRGSLSQLNISKILLKYPELNPDWLLTNRGKMLRSLKESKNITVAEKNQFAVFEPMSLIGNSEKIYFNSVEDHLQKMLQSKVYNVDFITSMADDTMLPTLSKNDIILAKKLEINDLTIQWNSMYVVETTNETFVKRIKQGSTSDKLLLCSENNFYSEFEIELSKIKGIALVRDALRFLD